MSDGSEPTLPETKKLPRAAAPEQRPRLLIFANYYLPGYKSGGPIQTIAAAVDALGDDYDVRIVTRDRDYGDIGPYDIAPTGLKWVRQGKAMVLYVPPRLSVRQQWRLLRELRDVSPTVVYSNSLLSRFALLQPVVLMQLRWLSGQLLLAPRGELSLGALGLKANRKRLYLAVLRHLLRDVDWQASSADEARDIKRYIRRARVHISADDRPFIPPQPRAHVPPSSPLEVVTVARITKMKNLEASIRSLSLCKAPVTLRLHGPIIEPDYWQQCQSLIRTLPDGVDVIHMGSTPHHEVQRVLGEADVYLLPTHGENFGQAIAEALAAGCPVVISDRTPWTNLVRSKAAGVALPPDDYRGMAAALDDFAASSADSMDRRRAAARSAYEASFIELPASLGAVLQKVCQRRLA